MVGSVVELIGAEEFLALIGLSATFDGIAFGLAARRNGYAQVCPWGNAWGQSKAGISVWPDENLCGWAIGFPDSVNDGDTAYGLCLYHSALDGKQYAFVSRDSNLTGSIAQLELFDAGGGRVGWQRVRTITLPDPRKVEGMVADQELGWIYLAQEKVGLWKLPAEPTRASDAGTRLL